MIGNFKGSNPSEVEEKIERLMDQHYIGGRGSKLLYRPTLINDVCELLKYKYQWQMGSYLWENSSGETVFLSWVENNQLHMIGWDVLYKEA